MENENEARIHEIDKILEELTSHRSMWAKSGGMGGKMALEANNRIEELKREREALLNDTNNIGISKKYALLRELKELRKEASFLKKMKYNFEIKKVEGQIQDFRNNSIKR